MWKKFEEYRPYTYGKHGVEFRFKLNFNYNYYGHENIKPHRQEIVAIWDSLNECFYEKETHKEVWTEDIDEWWDDDMPQDETKGEEIC